MSTRPVFQTEGEIAALTSFRAVAAFWLVLDRYRETVREVRIDDYTQLFQTGHLMVDAFFVLSGFILCYVYVRMTSAGRFGYASFIWARIARTLPLHYATFLGIAAMGLVGMMFGFGVSDALLNPDLIWRHLTMTQAWGSPAPGFNVPSWSVSAEWGAYWCFPLFLVMALALRTRPRVAAGLLLVWFAAWYGLYHGLTGRLLTEETNIHGVYRALVAFGAGALLYALYPTMTAWLSQAPRAAQWIRRLTLPLFAGILVAAHVGIHDTIMMYALAAYVYALALSPVTGFTALNSPVLHRIGEISYSTFLNSFPVLLVANGLAGKFTTWGDGQLSAWAVGVMIVFLYALSFATYHLIELPSRKALRGFKPSFKRVMLPPVL